VHFSGVVEHVIRQIGTVLSISETEQDMSKLLTIEQNVLRNILPVKEKLLARLRESNIDTARLSHHKAAPSVSCVSVGHSSDDNSTDGSDSSHGHSTTRSTLATSKAGGSSTSSRSQKHGHGSPRAKAPKPGTGTSQAPTPMTSTLAQAPLDDDNAPLKAVRSSVSLYSSSSACTSAYSSAPNSSAESSAYTSPSSSPAAPSSGLLAGPLDNQFQPIDPTHGAAPMSLFRFATEMGGEAALIDERQLKRVSPSLEQQQQQMSTLLAKRPSDVTSLDTEGPLYPHDTSSPPSSFSSSSSSSAAIHPCHEPQPQQYSADLTEGGQQELLTHQQLQQQQHQHQHQHQQQQSSSLPAPAPMADEFVSQRRRRRLNQIVPCPRKSRLAEFTCSVCLESYRLSVVDNPWWSVARQDCPKCLTAQTPRIDIVASVNSIEHDPNVQALYGEGLEDSGGEDCDDSDDDESCDGPLSGMAEATPLLCDGACAGAGAGAGAGVSVSAQAQAAVGGSVSAATGDAEVKPEREAFGTGEDMFTREEAAKLFVLMCHARACTGTHKHPQQAGICRSTKFFMLHLRDCPGSDLSGRDCKMPWCKAGKRMLDHLSHCHAGLDCTVCNPCAGSFLCPSLAQLKRVNEERGYVLADPFSLSSCSDPMMKTSGSGCLDCGGSLRNSSSSSLLLSDEPMHAPMSPLMGIGL